MSNGSSVCFEDYSLLLMQAAKQSPKLCVTGPLSLCLLNPVFCGPSSPSIPLIHQQPISGGTTSKELNDLDLAHRVYMQDTSQIRMRGIRKESVGAEARATQLDLALE